MSLDSISWTAWGVDKTFIVADWIPFTSEHKTISSVMGPHTHDEPSFGCVEACRFQSPFRVLWRLWKSTIGAAVMRGKRPSSALKASAS